jgi:hypothetical protein
VPAWYDVDDAASYTMLEAELGGAAPSFASPGLIGADAPASAKFVQERARTLGQTQRLQA